MRSQTDLFGKKVLTKKQQYPDPRDDPENCPICGKKLEFAWMVHNDFSGQDYPEMRCPNCNKYFTIRKDI